MQLRSRAHRLVLPLVVGASLLAVGLSATPGTSASGSPPAARATPRVSYVVAGRGTQRTAPSSGLRTELTLAARDLHVPYRVLRAQNRAIGPFHRATDVLARRYAGSFVASGHAKPRSGYQYWVLFTTRPPVAVDRLLRSLPVNVEVRYGHTYSQDAFTRLEVAALRAADSMPGTTGINATPTADYSGLVVRYLPSTRTARSADTSPLQAGVARALQAVLPAGRVAPRVVLVRGDHLMRANTIVQGGRNMDVCTGGFTANRGGVNGIITAKHCPNDLNYDGQTKVIAWLANAADGANGEIDLQFHATLNPNTTNKQFRYKCTITDCTDHTVQSVGNASVGDTVCKYGMTSNHTCAKVVDGSMCENIRWPSGALHMTCGMGQVNSDSFSSPGDSGGPVFLDTRAEGFVVCDNCYTNISHASDQLLAGILHN